MSTQNSKKLDKDEMNQDQPVKRKKRQSGTKIGTVTYIGNPNGDTNQILTNICLSYLKRHGFDNPSNISISSADDNSIKKGD